MRAMLQPRRYRPVRGGATSVSTPPRPSRTGPYRSCARLFLVRRQGAVAVTQPDYVLGHSDHELARLVRQAQFLAPITRALLARAGLAPGMRVLDVGSGAGDVAFLAAELVAPEGHVVGTDTAVGATAAASANAARRSLDNVEFLLGDPGELSFDRAFDAV